MKENIKNTIAWTFIILAAVFMIWSLWNPHYSGILLILAIISAAISLVLFLIKQTTEDKMGEPAKPVKMEDEEEENKDEEEKEE